ncbi:uncharacterized protein UTRI_00212 [Ustilago trichophora]|uniref:Uncharacterized protein n=1 Tax=Ustilago trichophora TaxID=86804 RepID=A0A5C3DUB6_9BASI|nr:uncharacterized protein UTRI_00212 [Ustilago trichophora]
MSQNTPSATPSRSRRGQLPETPGSARSTTSANTTIDRGTLLDRVEELELETHDLRRAIAAERERRRASSSSSSSSGTRRDRFARDGGSSLALRYFDPNSSSGDVVKEKLMEKLKRIDDEALTTLLTGSVGGLAGFIATSGGSHNKENQHKEENLALTVLDVATMVPSKSVGVEGVGSASDIDRRLLLQAQSRRDGGKQRRGGVEAELSHHRHAKNVQSWLQVRQRRTNSLIDSLVKFTLLEIESLTQTDSPTNLQSAEIRQRHITISGTFAHLFILNIKFDVFEDSSSLQSPQIQNLQVTLPTWLETTLNRNAGLYSKLIKRNDLPAILLMLRTMIPLVALRRNMYTNLMESYTDLVRDHVRAWETQTGIDFVPYHPPSSSSSASFSSSSSSSARKRNGHAQKGDEALAKSLIIPDLSETLVLKNKKGASLTLQFTIRWNRFGHASPHIVAIPNVPERLTNATNRTFLQAFQTEFDHMLKVALAQDGLVGLPDIDQDDEEDELGPESGRWGVMVVIHATIRAFFGLGGDGDAESVESRLGDESSMDAE